MPIVRTFVNGVNKLPISTKVTRESERGVDVATIVYPNNVSAIINDEIQWLLDMIDLTGLVFVTHFESVAHDESGYKNHGTYVTNPILNNQATHVTGWNGSVSAQQFTGLVAGDLVNNIQLNVFASAGNVIVKLYDDLAGSPNNLIGESVSTAVAGTGIQTFVLVTPAQIPTNGIVWAAFESNNASLDLYETTGLASGIRKSVVHTYGTGTPNPFGAPTSQTNAVWMAINYSGVIVPTVVGRYTNSRALNAVVANSCKVTVPDSANYAFGSATDFSVRVVAKTTAVVKQYLIMKGKEGSNKRFSIYFDATGKVNADISDGTNTVTVTSVAAYNDGVFHDIIASFTRAGNLVLYVDNVSISSAITTVGDVTNTNIVQIAVGLDSSGNPISYFNGNIEEVRLYGRSIQDFEVTTFANNKNPIRTVWFFGKVWFKDDKISTREFQCKSVGKLFGETDVKPTIYSNITVEDLVRQIIATNAASLAYIDSGVPTGITLQRYSADGKLVDILTDLAGVSGRTFRTEGLGIFRFEPISYQISQQTYTHGTNALVEEAKDDDTDLVNDFTVLGENIRYQSTELFNGNGSTLVFTLANSPVSTRVTLSGVQKIPEVDYTVDIELRTITFVIAPPSGTNNLQVEYEYEQPIFVRGTRTDSINKYGIRSKRETAPWLRTYSDGVLYANTYLNAYKDVQKMVKVTATSLATTFDDNDIVTVANSTLKIDGKYVMKSETWEYPFSKTTIMFGQFNKDAYEIHRDILAKLHDLESVITTTKDLRGYVPVTELLSLVDTLSIQSAHTFVQALGMSDVVVVTSIADIYYDDGSNYDSNTAYD